MDPGLGAFSFSMRGVQQGEGELLHGCATGDDDNGTDSGAAYLFDVASGQSIAKLLAADGAEHFATPQAAMNGNVVTFPGAVIEPNATLQPSRVSPYSRLSARLPAPSSADRGILPSRRRIGPYVVFAPCFSCRAPIP